jgi:hypothetical protein
VDGDEVSAPEAAVDEVDAVVEGVALMEDEEVEAAVVVVGALGKTLFVCLPCGK